MFQNMEDINSGKDLGKFLLFLFQDISVSIVTKAFELVPSDLSSRCLFYILSPSCAPIYRSYQKGMLYGETKQC